MSGKYTILATELDENVQDAGQWPDGRPKLVKTWYQGDETDLTDTTSERIDQLKEIGAIKETDAKAADLEGPAAEVQKRLAAGELVSEVKPQQLGEDVPDQGLPPDESAPEKSKEAPKKT
jgi:hypothetical protein